MDHLFRHQHGRMVSILTRIFGFEHLETIEDAVQDTFIKALSSWRNKMPDNPEAWLTAAAKNRMIDIFRSIGSEKNRKAIYFSGQASIQISELFLDHEIEDSQLRMIFSACHPILDPKEQIAFSLKSISGFSSKEIAASLLTSVDTIKKRLQRARKKIREENISFEIPTGDELSIRIDRVLEVIYLIFNEGFHSNQQNQIIRKELCGEALRLCKLLLKKPILRKPKVYALFALLCFHSSRLESKVNAQNELVNLKHQDRSKWFYPLMTIGSEAMFKAVENDAPLSSYHFEAAIAAEHVKAKSFEKTNWTAILQWYQKWYELQENPNILLNIAIVQIQLKQLNDALDSLNRIDPKTLAHKDYLYFATQAEYFHHSGEKSKALKAIQMAIEKVSSDSEARFLKEKMDSYQ